MGFAPPGKLVHLRFQAYRSRRRVIGTMIAIQGPLSLKKPVSKAPPEVVDAAQVHKAIFNVSKLVGYVTFH